jgi:uncharacterized protein with ParB-like and HNH nuclease domain
MAYQTPITIKDAITKIQRKKYVLPAIQREFVWKPDQIEMLFDSLMRGYPISTFLFWEVKKERIKDFEFYLVLKDYHEKKKRRNPKADLSYEEDIVAILDGQQRLTSLYIALKGTYAKKKPYYHWDSEHAFPKKQLHLNLLQKAEGIEATYDFQFLAEEEAKQNEEVFWYRVGDIMKMSSLPDVMRYLSRVGLQDSSKYSEEEIDFSLSSLTELHNVIHEKGTLSYYLERDQELDKVLQIFIRINSGGTKLSYSDLLLSIATAQWQEKDAREVIHNFVDEINEIGDGFDFDKDFVLKSCLVLGDIGDVKFKVDNFKKENMLQIEGVWEDIADALRTTVKLISHFGFNRDNLVSANALIPIAYYVYKRKLGNSYINSSNYNRDRQKVREWLIRSYLKRAFSGQPDSMYPPLRKIINENPDSFPVDKIIEHYKGTNKSIVVNEDDLEFFLDLEYKSSLAYSLLTILYEGGIDFDQRYHKDHIHPSKYFTDAKLKNQGISDIEKVKQYQDRKDRIANLQLIPATRNEEKGGKLFYKWFECNYSNKAKRNNFKDFHFFPEGESLKFDSFIDFYEKRKDNLRAKLREKLNVQEVRSENETTI